MRTLNLVLAAMFIIFAFVQLNDPDPVVWIILYGLLAVACVLAAFGQYYKTVLVVALAGYAAYSLFFISGVAEWLGSADKAMLFDDIAKMQYPYIEQTREFLGLFICVLVLAMHLISSRKQTERRPR